MADEWWNSARSGASSCSTTGIADQGTSGWSAESTGSGSGAGSSITFQEIHRNQPLSDAASLLVDPHMDWTQALLSGKAHETSFHAMLQEDIGTVRHQAAAGVAPCAGPAHDESVMNQYREVNHSFLLEQHHDHLSSNPQPPAPMIPYGCPSVAATLQSLLDATATTHSFYGNPSTVGYDNTPITPFSQLLKSSPPTQQESRNQLQFSSYMSPFLNSPATASDIRPGFFSPSPPTSQFLLQALEPRPSCSSSALMAKSNSEAAQDACSSATRKNVNDSAAVKKPRIETPSPLPTFKVRKEKLGDRITALQQLVSPFGKTDTASVLHEAIVYIKFLHDQVAALSTPYLKNGSPIQQHQNKVSEKSKDGDEKQDLRSRGLCLVPIASTYPVVSETAPEFWHPTFGGTFR